MQAAYVAQKARGHAKENRGARDGYSDGRLIPVWADLPDTMGAR